MDGGTGSPALAVAGRWLPESVRDHRRSSSRVDFLADDFVFEFPFAPAGMAGEDRGTGGRYRLFRGGTATGSSSTGPTSW